jgi:hypothetical protein
MALQQRTVQKMLREGFSGIQPLVVAATERKKLVAEVKSRLARFHGLDTKDYAYIREEEKGKLICPFTFVHADHYYQSDSFRLILDAANRLTIEETRYRGGSALVSDLDEVVAFVRACQERLERNKVLETKRAKVRGLLSQAILARVRKLAKEQRFDYMSEIAPQKLKLFIKLSDEHALAVDIPFKHFKKHLPQLRTTIVSVRKLYKNGIRFQVVSGRGLPWRQEWVKHESLCIGEKLSKATSGEQWFGG